MNVEDTEFGGRESEPLFSTVQKNPLLEESGKKSGKNKVAVVLSRAYFLALVALVVGLYLYVLVENIKSGNEALVTKTALVSIAVLIESLIFVITAFNLWVKFFCKIFRADPKSVQEQPPELKQSAIDDELYIYSDSLRIVKYSGNIHIPFSRLTKVGYLRQGREYCIFFFTKGNVHVCTFPAKQIPIDKIKELIPCPVLPYDTGMSPKEEKRMGRRREKRERPEWLNAQTLGGCAMALFAIGMGTAVIVLHYLVEERMPLFLGGFFILGGLIAFCGVLGHESKWCSNVVIPILFALALVVFTVGFFPAMYGELGVHTVREVMMSEPYTVCFFGLAGLGLYLVYAAIVNAVNIIRKK